MALTNLERLRLQVADRRRLVLHEVAGFGDELTLAFQVRGAPVFVGSLSVVIVSDSLTTVLYEGPDYSFDYALGLLRLQNAPAAGERVQCSYQWAAFADAELEDVLLQYSNDNDLVKSSIAVLQMVLADSDRFIKYTLGQEAVDRSQARQAITDLLKQLQGNQLGGLVGLVQANTTYRECLMSPYLEQDCV